MRLSPRFRRLRRRLARPLRRALRPSDYGTVLKRLSALEENVRNLLAARFPEVGSAADQRTALRRAELKVTSENGEDGILLHILSHVGVTDRRVVELGVGDITKCNSTNLALAFGWSGLLLDGSDMLVEAAERFYAGRLPGGGSVRAVRSWLTPENIDSVLAQNGFEGEIDLLSVDIDGNDYWIWKAIKVIDARVVVVEYNASFGSEEVLIARYDERFNRFDLDPRGWYHGASLAALENLGRAKGYVLVGCDSSGHNAFFVRRDLASDHFEALSAKDAYYPDMRRLREASEQEQFESLRALPFERE
jgi:hypothetical protein